MSSCEGYGKGRFGCALNCPTLWDGGCDIVDEIIEFPEIDEEDKQNLKELYNLEEHMDKEIDLVLKGGGAKIPALAGAVNSLIDNGFIIKRIAGTSAGAIIAALVSSGCRGEELKQLVMSTDMGHIAKDLNFPIIFNWFRDKWGVYKGNRFKKWIFEQLEERGVHTFEDVQIPLRVFATDLTMRRGIQFDDTTPFVLVSDAVRMSMSIPLVFAPVRYNKHVIVDGGLLNNYPIKTFDDSKRPTIGIRLINDKDLPAPTVIDDGSGFIGACVSTMMNVMENEHISEADWARTIQVHTGTTETTDFSMPYKEKYGLYDKGYTTVGRYVANSQLLGKEFE